jgi:hypothetical protein
MTLALVLECRLDTCENRSRFDEPAHIEASTWTDASAVGAIESGEKVHKAFCPGHSL